MMLVAKAVVADLIVVFCVGFHVDSGLIVRVIIDGRSHDDAINGPGARANEISLEPGLFPRHGKWREAREGASHHSYFRLPPLLRHFPFFLSAHAISSGYENHVVFGRRNSRVLRPCSAGSSSPEPGCSGSSGSSFLGTRILSPRTSISGTGTSSAGLR